MIKVKYFRIYFCLICLINYQIIKGQKSSLRLNIIGTIQDGGSPHIGCKKKLL